MSVPRPPTSRDDAVIGRAARWSLLSLAAVGAAVGGLVWMVGRSSTPSLTAVPTVEAPRVVHDGRASAPPVPFVDVTAEAGLRFARESGAEGEKLLPETMGSGCAFLDVDNDGDQDLLLVNSTRWPWSTRPPPPSRPTLALYRNDGRGHFVDATREAGLAIELYGMGVAVGDYDNDGWVDLFVTGLGASRLLRNGHGKFIDVTREAGVAGKPDDWSTSAAFVDVDRDGDLDLFVANYVKWSREIDFEQGFQLAGLGRAYGPPRSFEGRQPYLYRNDGHGRFQDVAEESGLHVRNAATGVAVGKSLGVAPVDVDRDGWIDLIVANDTVPNFVFRNRGQGRFEEIGAATGLAFDNAGNARGAMGIDTGDFRGDGTLGVAIGNFANEMTALYVSQSEPTQFVDEANAAGLGAVSRTALTFGVLFFDYDLDGRLDLVAANGHLEEDIAKVQERQTYAQSPQLYWNRGGDGPDFEPVPGGVVGEGFATPMVGRGSAYADIDGDGDLDLILTQVSGPPRLLRNDQALGHAHLRMKLVGAADNRDAIGAWVEATVGTRTLRRQVMPARGYLSQSELPVTIGLGEATRVDRLRIVWPNGAEQVVDDAPVNRTFTVTER
ncbi:MAG: CRTAC1 family protein [Vicinamibacterales bacterium]